MKYAKEVIDLMGAYPGREFRMIQLVRDVTRAMPLDKRARDAARNAVLRVLDSLIESGQVEKNATAANSVFYSWRIVRHGHSHLCDRKCDNTASASRL